MRDRVASVAVAVAALVLTASVASAAFVDRESASATLSTGSLQPPTGPTTAPGPCTIGVAASITVRWVPTASTWADGYEVRASLLAGGPYATVGTVAGHGSTSHTVSGLAFATTYYYVVVATKDEWRSPPTAEVSRTTLSPLCT